LDIRTKYLQSVPAFNIVPAPLTTSVTRKFLSTVYGGHSQQLIQYMNKVRSKENPTIWPDKDYNPYLPSSPGVPGLIFSARHDILEHDNWRLFVRSAKRANNLTVHDYYGTYTTSLVGYLTRIEFGNLTHKVRRPTNNTDGYRLIDIISTQVQDKLLGTVFTRTYNECKAMRARIFFRKRGKLPVERTAIEKVIKKEVDTPCDYGDGLSLEDIRRAFLHGEEVI
jgi:hypothetical protein